MNIGGLRRTLLRTLVPLAVLASAGVVSAVTAQPALAACVGRAEAYVIVPEGVLRINETEPLNRPFYDLVRDVPDGGGTVSYQLGGSGMRPGEDPFWNAYRESNGTHVVTQINTRTNNNCISNQRFHSVFGFPGTSYLYYASYYPGNTGGVIAGQQHFRITFV